MAAEDNSLFAFGQSRTRGGLSRSTTLTQGEEVLHQGIHDRDAMRWPTMERYACAWSQPNELQGGRILEFSSPVRRSGPERLEESVEMRWLVENSAVLARYSGEWLLIVGQELVEHSADFSAIKAAVRERNIKSPFVYYVPAANEANAIFI